MSGGFGGGLFGLHKVRSIGEPFGLGLTQFPLLQIFGVGQEVCFLHNPLSQYPSKQFNGSESVLQSVF